MAFLARGISRRGMMGVSRSILSPQGYFAVSGGRGGRGGGISGLGVVGARSISSLVDTSAFTETQMMVRDAVGRICQRFDDSYWASKDETSTYPHEFHQAIAGGGWIGVSLPEEIPGGAGLGVSEAVMVVMGIAESGAGVAGAQSVHANIYATQPVYKFGTEKQKMEELNEVVRGRKRVCFGVTEPNTGLETLKLKTRAMKMVDSDDGWEVYGEKIWISSAQVADKMVLLARTTPIEQVQNLSEGLSLFFIDFDKTKPGLELKRIKKMGGRAIDANEVFFDGYRIGRETLVGKEGDGWKIVLHGMNAERCLLAGEALGLGYAALNRATKYAKERVVFGNPIGKNQAIQHALAESYMKLEAAKLATLHAAKLYDRATAGEEGITQVQVGAACNSAKYLAAEAAFEACERAVLAHGGMGYAQEFHVERYLREAFVPRLAPVSREMVLNYVGEKVLGLPKSY